jgi:1,4-alpha-glucan branching enzyme
VNARLQTVDSRLGIDPEAARALSAGRVGDPFSVLGPHRTDGACIVRAYVPGALSVQAIGEDNALLAELTAVNPPGLFAAIIPQDTGYRWRIRWPGGVTQETEDPYSFGLLLGDVDIYLIAEGRHFEIGRVFGAQAMSVSAVNGVRFAVWAPNARRVSVV